MWRWHRLRVHDGSYKGGIRDISLQISIIFRRNTMYVHDFRVLWFTVNILRYFFGCCRKSAFLVVLNILRIYLHSTCHDITSLKLLFSRRYFGKIISILFYVYRKVFCIILRRTRFWIMSEITTTYCGFIIGPRAAWKILCFRRVMLKKKKLNKNIFKTCKTKKQSILTQKCE